jgi:hypothetical protein
MQLDDDWNPGLADTLLICDEFGWTVDDVEAMPEYVRDLALDFLNRPTAVRRRESRRSIRQRATAARWTIRHALWRIRHA